jgi:ribosomal-protein-serine acetyltransferase
MIKPILIDVPEEIITPRLTLKMPKAGYGEQLHQVIVKNYEDYVKWLNWPPQIPTQEDVEIDCRKHHSDFILRNYIRYLIIETKSNQIIGRCGYPNFQTNWSIPAFGISYFIGKDYRGNKYALEVAYTLAKLAFKELGARKVQIQVDATNSASKAIAEALGFELEAKQKGTWASYNENLAEIWTYACFDENTIKEINFVQ